MSNEYHFKKGWLLVALLGISLSAGAQQLVRGTVSDGTEPLPAVRVIVKGTASGTQTDENGAFSIRVNPEDGLQFSLLGFQMTEVTVGDRQVIDVGLALDAITEERRAGEECVHKCRSRGSPDH